MVKFKKYLLRGCLVIVGVFIIGCFALRTTTSCTRYGRWIVENRLSLLVWSYSYKIKKSNTSAYRIFEKYFAKIPAEDRRWVVDDRSTLIEAMTSRIGRTPSKAEKRIYYITQNDPEYLENIEQLAKINSIELIEYIDSIYDCSIYSNNCDALIERRSRSINK